MKFATLNYEKHEHVGVLTVHRPEALNALNSTVLSELNAFLDHADNDSELRCLIITGGGEKAFVAGADIKEMGDLSSQQAREMAHRGQSVFSRIETSKFACIAAVNGFALGGGLELALACDFIIMSSKAKVGLPEVGLGLIPGYGGTQRLSRWVGKGQARLMALTGDMFTAEEALAWGLAARVVEPGELREHAMKLANSIASKGPVAVGLAKRAINEGYDMSQAEGLNLEADLFSQVFESQDHHEGIAAFIEKRKPQFKGN